MDDVLLNDLSESRSEGGRGRFGQGKGEVVKEEEGRDG